jgi:hypothetical protein
MFNLSYTPDPALDFPVLERIMITIDQQSYSCVKLQSMYDRVDKYTKKNYWERVRYIAGMAQEMVEMDRPEWCTIQE